MYICIYNQIFKIYSSLEFQVDGPFPEDIKDIAKKWNDGGYAHNGLIRYL